MIDEALAAFVQGPVMLIVACADARGRPAAARAMGARFTPDRSAFDLFIHPIPWPDLASGLRPGASLAVTAHDPADYHSYQIKGTITDRAVPDDAHLAWADAYFDRVMDHFARAGIPPPVLDDLLSGHSAIRVRVEVTGLFEQTPGPSAGRQIGGLACA